MNDIKTKANEANATGSENKAKTPLKIKASQRTSVRVAVPCTAVIY